MLKKQSFSPPVLKGIRRTILIVLFLFAASIAINAQKVEIRGKVLSGIDNEPLIGVSVFEKGTTNGVVTDLDGFFKLSVKQGGTVELRYVGFSTYEFIAQPDHGTYNVVMKSVSNTIDELVVVGYGIQKKSVMSSAVSKVTSDQLNFGNPTNVSNALKGKVSGVMITSESGQPGSSSKIRIRGIGTVNNSDPLYIVDGLPSDNGIDNINPTDIESIEILKDAASAAIYGARGANGVVLVTTKNGKNGKVSVNYEFTYGIQNPDKKLNLLSSKDYQTLINEMASNSGKSPYFQNESSINTDWQDVVKNSNAPIVNHKLSVSGGSERSNYYISMGYLSQEGIFGKGYSDYSRINFHLNYNNTILDVKDRNWLNRIKFGAILSFSKSEVKGTSIGNSEVGGIMASIDMLPPTEPVYQTDENTLAQYNITYPNHVVSPDGRVYNIIEMRELVNPLADLQVNHNQRSIPISHTYNFSLNIDLLPGLTYKTTYGLDYNTNTVRRSIPVYELNATSKNSSSKVQNDKSDSEFWQWENILSYNNKFGLHNFGAMLGTSMSSLHSEYLGGADYDLLSTDIDKAYIGTATAAEELSQIWGGASDHKMASVFGRLNYNYDEKYLLEVVVRRDGSSNFSHNNQYAVFPSVSAGWVMTQEKFMNNRPKWFDYAKLRLSWGQNGNENIGAFQYTTMMSQGKNAVIAGKVYTGMLPSGYSNSDLKWETSEQTDLGLDLRFLKSSLTFSVDYYQKRTKDMLLWKPIPLYTSYSGMTVNAGSVKNSGVEFEASYRTHIKKLNLGFVANASYLKNEVTDQGNDKTGIDGITGGMGGQVTYSQNGHPYGFFYGYVHDGIFQNQAEIDNYKTEDGKLKQPNAKPGDIRFKDLDGINGIDANDRTQIGNPIPDWTYGFTFNMDYKGFDFTSFFQGTIGNDIYKLYRRSNVALGNFESFWMKRWHGEGTSNWVPRIVEGDNNNYQISDFFVQKGSYLRLKVAQLGYTLPKHLTTRYGIQKLRFFVQGENIFTLTGYDGYDPEVGTRNGLDSGTYPQARTFTFGVDLVL
jgi:TonB-linked SusC/RagA family outer membrane protein